MNAGYELPMHPAELNFRTGVNVILSAKAGKPIGFEFSSLVQVAHHLENSLPSLIVLFGAAIRSFGHGNILELQDETGKWKKKAQKIREDIEAGFVFYEPDASMTNFLCFLFPVVKESVGKIFKKIGYVIPVR